MSINLMLCASLFSIFVVILIIHLVANEKINIKYSLVWIFMFLLFILCMLIPGLLDIITNFFGFKTASTMILSLLIAVLVIINITNTVINSNQDKKIRLLIQEISILKMNDREKNNE